MVNSIEQKNKISFNLNLSNLIFKANLKSLIIISKENIDSIPSKNEEFIKEIIEAENSITPLPNDYFNQKLSHIDNLAWILLNSIYITAYSYFERHLYSLANIVEDRTSNKIKIKDFGDNGIRQYRKYLHLIGKLKSAEQNINWQKIELFQKVRNKLTHNGGIIINDPSKTQNLEKDAIFKFLSQYNVIMAGSFGEIRIQKTFFIEAFSELTSKLSDELSKEINESYPIE